MPRDPARDRVSTGVAGLDAMLGGGVFEGDSTLVAGSPGTGKTTLGMQFIGAGIRAGEPGVYVTFEYLPQQMHRDAARKGWPLKKWEEDGKLQLVCTTPDVLLAEVRSGETILDEVVRELGAKRLVIDSMTHFEFYTREAAELRTNIAGLMNHLRLLELSSVVTHEIPQIIGPNVTVSRYGLEFLVDNVVLLRYVELEGELQKAINVLKFRGGDHDRHYRSFKTTSQGMVVESEFTGVENISGGSARRNVRDRARELV